MCAVAFGALLLLATPQEEIQRHRDVLGNDTWGNYWDKIDSFDALRGMGTVAAAEVVIPHLAHAEFAIREKAALCLARMRTEADAVTELLIQHLRGAREPLVRENVAWTLRLREAESAADALAAALGDREAGVRRRAAEALGAVGSPDTHAEALAELIGDPDAGVRMSALDALARLNAAGAAEAVERAVTRGRDPITKAVALETLAVIAPDRAAAVIADALEERAAPVRIACARALAVHPDPVSQMEGAQALIADRDWQVRAAAIQMARQWWLKESIDLLIPRLDEEDGRLRLDVLTVLVELCGRNLGWESRPWSDWWSAQREGYTMPPRPTGPAGGLGGGNGARTATFFGVPIMSNRLSFGIDYSGSMFNPWREGEQQTKMELSLNELRTFLEGSEQTRMFNVWSMSTEAVANNVRAFQRSLVPASPPNRQRGYEFAVNASQVLGSLSRGRDGMYDCIMEMMQDPNVDTLVLISDGASSYGQYVEQENFVEHLQRENRYRMVVIHTILIGESGTNPRFFQALAAGTGGVFRHVTGEEDDDGGDNGR